MRLFWTWCLWLWAATMTALWPSARALAQTPPSVDAALTVRSDGPGGLFAPGEPLTWTLRVTNTGAVGLGPLEVVVPVPQELRLTGVFTGSGQGQITPDEGAAVVSDFFVAAGATVEIEVFGEVRDVQTLLDLGRDFASLDGLVLSAQASVIDPADPLRTPQPSDDPGTAEALDPTALRLSVTVDLSASRKTVLDANGGDPVPGDTLEYVLVVENRGNVRTPVRIDDPTPAGHEGCVAAALPGGVVCDDAGMHGEVTVEPGNSVALRFTMRVSADVAHGQLLRNTATLTSTLDPSAQVDVTSRGLRAVALPALSMTKVALDAPQGLVRAGETFTYTITLRNDGPAAATQVVITDDFVVPDTVALEALDDGAGAGGSFRWVIDRVEPGAQVAVRLRVTVGADTEPQDLRNQAFVTAAEVPREVASDDPGAPGRVDPTIVTVEAPLPSFTVTKTAVDLNGGELRAGDTIEYQIAVVAAADVRLGAVVSLLDRVPRELTVVVDGGARPTPQGLLWELPDAWVAGQPEIRTFRAQVNDGVADGTRIANQAALQGLPAGEVPSDDPTTAAAGDPTVLIVRGVAAGDASKAASDENGGDLLPGETLRYHFVVGNHGDAPAPAPQLVDDLPPEVTFVRAEPAAVVADNRLVWRLPPLNPGETMELDLFVTVNGDVPAGTVIRNQATLALGQGADPVATDDPATAAQGDATRITVAEVPVGEELVATKRLVLPADGAYDPGDEVTYQLTVLNRGMAPTPRLEVLDPLDDNLTGTFAEGGLIDAQGRTAAWSLAPLAPGEQAQMLLRAVIGAGVPRGTRIANQYGLRAVGGGLFQRSDDPATPEADDPVSFVVGAPLGGQPGVRCDKTWRSEDGGPPAAGEGFVYFITCANSGETQLQSLILTDVLPPELVYLPGSTVVGGAPVADPGGDSPVALGLELLRAGPLLPGSGVVTQFSARVLPEVVAGTRVANQAQVVAREAGLRTLTDDPSTGAFPDPTVFTVPGAPPAAPDLRAFRKTARVLDVPDPTRASPGDTVTWTLVAVNQGDGVARNVVISDTFQARQRYVPNSLRFIGAPLTDAADGDPGELTGDGITVRVGDFGPGERRVVEFDVVVLDGPLVQNQGRLTAAGLQPEPSDDDANEANGNGITVVPVGDAPVRAMTLTKAVELDPAGAIATYTLVLTNTGTLAIAGAAVLDPLPELTTFDRVVRTPPGATADFEPASGSLSWTNLALGPGARAEMVFTARVDADAPDGTAICNRATATAGDTPQARTEPACFTVEQRRVSLQGRVFHDVDGDASFANGLDLPLEGMTVRAVSAADAGPRTARTDAGGAWRLDDLPRGDWSFEAVTSTGTTVALAEASLDPGQARVDLPVVPGGRVYHTRTGKLLDGVRLLLYEDRDLTNEDVFDEASRRRRVLVPGSDLESPSQQGQVTAHGGLYRFKPLKSGRYFIEASPSQADLVWPSVLRPTSAGVLPAGPRAVAETALPLVAEDDGPPWFAAFQSDGVTGFRQNHLPLDPLDALLEVDKRALRPTASVGDVVTYEIDIVNRSPKSLRFDAARARGGVFVEDRLPPGFKYVAGSAALVRVGDRGERALFADDPAGARTLRFGRVSVENGKNVLRPMDLAAGERLRLRYQLVVGTNVRPKEIYRNRARLTSDTGQALSAEAEAEVAIVPDAELDQSVLLGKVFCDANGDEEQSEGEAGLPGALVLADTGDFAVTDSAGKFHFQALDAGTHAFKLDADSLLPGAVFTTDETRILSLTRGLPAKIAYGVTCPAEVADDPTLELAPEGLAAALAALGKTGVVVTGNVRALRARVGREDFAAGAPELGLLVDGVAREAPDLRPGGGGVTSELVFEPRVPAGAPAGRWALWLGPLGGLEQVITAGEGPPPAQIPWDQRGPAGEPVLEKGRVYAYRLEVSDPEGRTWGSPAGVFGVGANLQPDPPLVAALRGNLFSAEDKPEPLLERELAKLLPKLKKQPGAIRVESHGDDALPGPEMQARTARQAQAAAERLRALLGWPAERVVAVGMGSARPLAPNLSERQRARNRRLELRALPAVAERGGASGPPTRTVSVRATYNPVARVGRDEAVADERGEFALTAAVPEDGVLEVSLRDVDGRRAVIPIRRHAGAPAEVGRPRVVALAGTPPDGLTLAGAPLALPAGVPTVEGPERLETETSGRPRPATLVLKGGETATQWSLVVLAPDGRESFRAGGPGGAPDTVVLSPGAAPWAPGDHEARLTVRFSDGGVVQSPPRRLHVGPGGPASPAAGAAWRFFLDGRAVTADRSGRLFAETVVRTGGRVLVEAERPDGARLLLFVRPAGEQPSAAAETPGATAAAVVAPDGPQAAAAPPSLPSAAVAAPPTAPGGSTAASASLAPSAPAAASAAIAPSAPAAASGPYQRIDEVGTAAEPRKGPAVDDLGLQAYVPAGAPTSAAVPAPPPPRRPMTTEAREAMARFGRAELLRVLAPPSSADVDVPARKLAVSLPAAGATLTGRSLPVRGTTHPENRVFVNGVELPVGHEGQFGGAALFPPGQTELEIATLDTQGNRGVLRRAVKPADSQWFLLALGDSAAGASGNELDGVTDSTRVGLGDSAYLHGRGVAWLRGRVQGKELLGGAFEEYEVEAHVDTARRRTFEPAFRELIDPERYYPTYGDSAALSNPIHTRGPVYVLVRADESHLVVGDFQSEIKGLELFRYDRSLYGAQLKLDKEAGDEGDGPRWHHEANAFVADLDAPERHAYVELRGTGGSLYYLPYEELIEGSERVYLVERDRETGIERQRRLLGRDVDYTIRYREGRILMKSPVPRVTMDSFGPLPQARNGRRGEVLGGHPVFLAVEMDHRDARARGENAFGAHVRETYAETLTLGGGYLEEGQSRDPSTRYKLWGTQAGLRYKRRTGIEAEWVESRNGLGSSLFSGDGGLTYEPFHGRDADRARGTGTLVRGGLELDDLFGEADRDHWYTEGYWQFLAPGFYSGGTLQEQGLEKYGALTRYHLNENHVLRLQHDGIVADEPETQGAMTFHGFRRHVTTAGHTYTDGPLLLDTTLTHTEDDESAEEPVFETDVLNVGAEYALTPRWTLIGEQELVVRGDARLHEGTSDLLATTAGVRYRPTDEVAVEGTETVRWSGDNATQIGLRTEVDDRHTLYVHERFQQADGKAGATSVVGGEERWGEDQSGRSYGEYQLEAGELGARNRAVLGVGKRTKLVKGLTLDAAYERSQVMGGPENGELSSDTVSLGSEWLDSKRVKVSGRYELRYDDNAEDLGRRDRMQFLALNGADWLLTPDFTLLLRLNYAHTFDLGLKATEAELVEGSVGLAFRPVTWDDFAALIKYTKRYEQRPVDLLVELPVRDEYDVVALVPMLELPWRFQLVEKVALKRMATRTLNLPTVVSTTVLWINRLNYHLTATWDAGAEYRVLKNDLAQNTRHGAVGEVNYIIQKKVRLGLGYNFTSFSDDEFARLDEDHGGPFFRVVANY